MALTETFLDASVKAPTLLLGYVLIGRRDRGGLRQKGGILLFARQEFAKNVVCCATSEVAERLWAVVHTDIGPVLFGVWYRPPCHGEVASIKSFGEELGLHKDGKLGVIVCGDMNAHHKEWLQFSQRTSPEGRALFDVCCIHYLRECIKKPTRGPNLLDLT